MSALSTAAALLLTGCGDPTPTTNTGSSGAAAEATAAPDVAAPPTPAADATDRAPTPGTLRARKDYLGRWRGVEGLNLVVTPGTRGDDAVTLAMQWSLDDKGTYDGVITADGIAFVRNGSRELLRPSDGAATGLKWLDGKKDCLTVTAGEGYCRD